MLQTPAPPVAEKSAPQKSLTPKQARPSLSTSNKSLDWERTFLEKSVLIPKLPEDNIPRQLLERFLATIAFIAFLPVMIAIGAYIKATTPGPAIFCQKRLGKGGRPFYFIKFRTMYVDARQRFPELYAYKYSEKEMQDYKFKLKDDPRVTPQGRWLRKSTLDELPNFWNVMNGSMSIIGPRPEIPEMMQYYEGEMLEKFSVKPGITGLAQASGRGELGFYDTVDMDVTYVRQRSFSFDVKLFFQTIWKVIIREGAF